MRILAVETTEKIGSLAAFDDGRLLNQIRLNSHARSAQSLAPGIAGLLREVAWTPRDVELVAVNVGPGSFTGLRVGVATAKTFAYAVGADVLGTNTLEVIATQAPSEIPRIAAAIDAHRGQVFAAQFDRDADGKLQWITATEIMQRSEWLASLNANIAATGPILRELAFQIPAGARMLPNDLWSPTAASVGALAWRQYQAGRRDDVLQLVPQYFRQSAAEEKRRIE